MDPNPFQTTQSTTKRKDVESDVSDVYEALLGTEDAGMFDMRSMMLSSDTHNSTTNKAHNRARQRKTLFFLMLYLCCGRFEATSKEVEADRPRVLRESIRPT